MASPIRPAGMHGGNNKPAPNYAQLHALPVVPFNSMPYIDPPPPGDSSLPTEVDTKPAENIEPSVVWPSTQSTQELDNAVFSARKGVGLTGSAATGKVGPIVGLIDIGESDDAYLFRVSLPGVARDEMDFSCKVETDGKVLIKGVTTTGEKIVCKNSRIFKMQTQNLCPPGRFSVTFQLPGPVDQQLFSGCFGTDGILEGIVKKQR